MWKVVWAHTTGRRGFVLESMKFIMIPRSMVECGILRGCSDGLYGLFSVWWSIEEVLIVVLVPVMVRVRALGHGLWIIRCGSSFHSRLPATFLSKLIRSLVRSKRVSWRFWMSACELFILRWWRWSELSLWLSMSSGHVGHQSSSGRRTRLRAGVCWRMSRTPSVLVVAPRVMGFYTKEHSYVLIQNPKAWI